MQQDPTEEKIPTVSSADNKVTLDIPEDALPEGTTKEDIKITPMDEKVSDLKPDEEVNMIGYNLEPDGLKFEKPVTLSMTTEYTPDTQVQILYVSEGKFVELEDQEAVFDEEAKTVTVSAPIDHFSGAFVGFRKMFRTTMDPIGEAVVGEPFEVTAKVFVMERPPYSFVSDNGIRFTKTFLPEKDWYLDGEFFVVDDWQDSIVTPKKVDDRPPYTRIPAGQREFTIKQSFTCTEVGFEGIKYRPKAYWWESVEADWPGIMNDGTEDRRTSGNGFVSEIVKCVAREAVEDSKIAADMVEIEVIEVDGNKFPVSQFRIGGIHQYCPGDHYHAETAYSLKSSQMKDPAPDACGFGIVGEVPIEKVSVEKAWFEKFQSDHPADLH